MLYGLRKYFHLRNLKELVRTEKHRHDTVVFANASFIGLLYDAGDPEFIVEVTQFAELLKSKGKRVQTLGFINKVDEKRHQNDFIFDRKSLNWMLVPQSQSVMDFINTPFDILINLYTDENLALEHISARSRATFRIGFFQEGKNHCFDMIIRTEPNAPLRTLTRQAMHFLGQIRK